MSIKRRISVVRSIELDTYYILHITYYILHMTHIICKVNFTIYILHYLTSTPAYKSLHV